MAKNYSQIYKSVYTDKNKMDFSNSMIRGNGIPLDITEIWDSIDAAKTYAASDPVAYQGQIIAVITDNDAQAYIITPIEQEDGSYIRPIADLTEINNQLASLNTEVAEAKERSASIGNNKDLSDDSWGIRYNDYNKELSIKTEAMSSLLFGDNSYVVNSTDQPITRLDDSFSGTNYTCTEEGQFEDGWVATYDFVLNTPPISCLGYSVSKKNVYTPTLGLWKDSNNAIVVVESLKAVCKNNADNRPCAAVIGDDVVVFEAIPAGTDNAPVDYVKGIVINQGDPFCGFCFVEKQNMLKFRSWTAKPCDTIYQIALSFTDSTAIFPARNQNHRFILYKDPTNNYYIASAGSVLDAIRPPQEVINGVVSFGRFGSFYVDCDIENEKLTGSYNAISVENSCPKVNLKEELLGFGNLAIKTPISVTPATAGTFGTNPANGWITEAELGTFSYYQTTNKPFYGPINAAGTAEEKTAGWHLPRVNPVGNYVLRKIEGSHPMYLADGSIITAPEAYIHGFKIISHAEKIGQTTQTDQIYVQFIMLTRWMPWNPETGKGDATQAKEQTRFLYRTLIKYRDGLWSSPNFTKIKNWSYFHEIITSENIEAKINEIAPTVVEQSINENTNLVKQEELANAVNGCIKTEKIGTELSDRFYTFVCEGTLDCSSNMITQTGISNATIHVTFLAFNHDIANAVNDKTSDKIIKDYAATYKNNGGMIINSGYFYTDSGTNGALSGLISKILWDDDNGIYKIYGINPQKLNNGEEYIEGTFKAAQFSIVASTLDGNL